MFILCGYYIMQGKKLSEELEEKGDDESDGGDVSDEDEAADIDPRDIKVAQEKGWLYIC